MLDRVFFKIRNWAFQRLGHWAFDALREIQKLVSEFEIFGDEFKNPLRVV